MDLTDPLASFVPKTGDLFLEKDRDEFSLGIGVIFVPGHCNLLV